MRKFNELSTLKVLTLTALLAVVGRADAETHSGRTSASASSMVSMTFPSVHGINVPSMPAQAPSSSSVVFASRSAQASVEMLPLQLMSTNGASAIQMVRTVRRPADRAFALASSGRATGDADHALDVRSSSREGSLGWTVLNDRVEVSSMSTVSSGPASKTTVVYEIWDF